MGFATYNKIAILFILYSIISDVCVNGNYYYNINVRFSINLLMNYYNL